MDTPSYSEDAAHSQTVHRSLNDKTITNLAKRWCCCR